MHPLGPLGIEPAVRLLVLGLEDADDLALTVLHEVGAGAALINPLRVDPGIDRVLCLADSFCEYRIV